MAISMKLSTTRIFVRAIAWMKQYQVNLRKKVYLLQERYFGLIGTTKWRGDMSVLEGMLWALYITMIVLCIHYDGYEKGRKEAIEEMKIEQLRKSLRERDGK